MCPLKKVQCCCCCFDDYESDDEIADSCKLPCCLDSYEEDKTSRCVAIHHTCLSYIFPRLLGKVVDTTDKRPVLAIAGRNLPRSSCYRMHLYTYLTVMAVLTSLWFLLTLLEQVIDHSATSCSELSDKDVYYVCFNLTSNWTAAVTSCHGFPENSSVHLLCYTYSISTSALGIAFSMASLVSTLVSIAFRSTIYCSDERCSRRGLIVIQFLFVLVIICCAVSFGVLFATKERAGLIKYFFNERAPLRSILLVLLGVSLLLGVCVPWRPLQNKRKYVTIALEQP